MKYINLEIKENIGILTINKPEVLNALDAELLGELSEAISEVEKNEDIRALLLTGAGRAFVAGADIGAQSVLSVEGGKEWGENGSAILRKIERLQIPTIAAVNGYALGGGCELAMACDLIVASEKAKFGQPEVSLGIIPGFSGTQRLARRIGVSKAKELIFTGRQIGAAEAERMGLVNAVAEPEKLLEKAKELALEILKNAPMAVAYAKAAIDEGIDTDIDSGIRLENVYFALCFATQDQKEGMAAFLEKRKAKFAGK